MNVSSKLRVPAMPEQAHTLIMGASASGKSTTATIMKQRGIPCIDADYDEGIAFWQNKKTGAEESIPENPPDAWGEEHFWRWKIGRLAQVLASSENPVYVCGTAGNRAEAYPLFGRVIVLTADKQTVVNRLATRENNDFGKLPGERDWALKEHDRVVAEAQSNNFTIIDTSDLDPSHVVEIITANLEK